LHVHDGLVVADTGTVLLLSTPTSVNEDTFFSKQKQPIRNQELQPETTKGVFLTW